MQGEGFHNPIDRGGHRFCPSMIDFRKAGQISGDSFCGLFLRAGRLRRSCFCLLRFAGCFQAPDKVGPCFGKVRQELHCGAP